MEIIDWAERKRVEAEEAPVRRKMRESAAA
jgi:hypothetical protein